MFMGDNPNDSIFLGNQYFIMSGLTKEKKLVAPTMSLNGDALSWYQWIDSREAFGSWEI